MPRKRTRAKAKTQRANKSNVGRSKTKSKQGLLGGLVDMGADTIKGIGRGIMPGLFKTAMVTAPSNVGIVAPRATYRVNNQAQRLAEFDPDRSQRVTGNGLFWDRVVRRQQDTGLFFPTAVNVFPKWRGVTPLSVDPRSFEIAKTYQYYAFRLLRFTYIPTTGSSGEHAEANLGFGISQDAQEFVDLPDPTITQMMEQNRSIMTPAWNPCTLTYEHDGTRVWRVDPASEGTIDEVVQCLLGGVASGVLPGTTPRTESIGDLYVEYVMDLYEPQPVLATGEYTVALPSNTADGNTIGFGFYEGNQYPDGYNTSFHNVGVMPENIPDDPPPEVMLEEKVDAKASLVASLDVSSLPNDGDRLLLPGERPIVSRFKRGRRSHSQIGSRMSELEAKLKRLELLSPLPLVRSGL